MVRTVETPWIFERGLVVVALVEPRPASVASRAELLDRDQEIGRIETALIEASLGRGRFAVVEGPAGMGKTALLAAGRTAATERGMRVLRARANELEREFPFGVVRQLFEPLLAEATTEERASLLQGAAGVAATLLALPGRRLRRVRGR